VVTFYSRAKICHGFVIAVVYKELRTCYLPSLFSFLEKGWNVIVDRLYGRGCFGSECTRCVMLHKGREWMEESTIPWDRQNRDFRRCRVRVR